MIIYKLSRHNVSFTCSRNRVGEIIKSPQKPPTELPVTIASNQNDVYKSVTDVTMNNEVKIH